MGQNVTFTVTVTNSGPANATGVAVTDLLPSGYTFVGVAPSVGTYNSTTGFWSLGSLANAASATLGLTGTVLATGTYINTATITASTPTDPNAANNSATVTVTPVAQADLTISKTHTGNFTQGQIGATYTLAVSNIGSGPTTAPVTVTDTVPTGLTATALAGTGWTCTQPAGPCTRSDALAASASYPAITLTVNVAANAPANVTNTATVAGGGDATPGNNTASNPTTILASSADIAVTKTVNNPVPVVGTNVTFTITVTNTGPSNATGVQITDQLPNGYLFASSTASQGAYTNTTGIWSVGNLNAAQSASLQVVATVVAGGTYTNTATRTASSPTDTNAGNDVATATVAPSYRGPTAVPGSNQTANEGAQVCFNGSGSIPGDWPITTYSWSFGDGGTAFGLTPCHIYADNGVYTVTLTVTDSIGAINSAGLTVTVNNAVPTVNAGQDRVVAVETPQL